MDYDVGGTKIIILFDAVHKCSESHLKFSQAILALFQMANVETGRISIQYRKVQCQPTADIIMVVDRMSRVGSYMHMTLQVQLQSVYKYLKPEKLL